MRTKEVRMSIRLILSVFIVSLFLTTALPAQGPDTLWTRTYGTTGDQYGYSVTTMPDGGFMVCGKMTGGVHVLRTDSVGASLWSNTYGGAGGYSILRTLDGFSLVVGTKNCGSDAGKKNFYLVKIDDGGDSLWTRAYGGPNDEEGFSVIQTQGGGFAIAGKTLSAEWDVYILKVDELGDSVWVSSFGWGGTDIAFSSTEAHGEGQVVAGFKASGWNDDVLVAKIGENGIVEWTRTYGGSGGQRAYGITRTSDGGYVVVGFCNPVGPEATEVYMLKIDAFGDTLWTRMYGGTGADSTFAVQETRDGGFIIAGCTTVQGGSESDVYILKTNCDGILEWSRVFGGSDKDRARAVKETPDGGFIVAGYTRSFGGGGYDVYLLRLAPPEPMGAWLSEDSTGFPVSQFVSVEENGTLELNAMLENDSGPAVEIVYTLGYDPSVLALSTAELDLSEFPSPSLWAVHSAIRDTIWNDTGRILLYLSNGWDSASALPEGIHRLAILGFDAQGTGRFGFEPCLFPPGDSGIHYVDIGGTEFEPVWDDCVILVYSVDPDIALFPAEFMFATGEGRTLYDTLEIYNWGFNSPLAVDSILTSSEWLRTDPQDLLVDELDSAAVQVIVSSSGLPLGIYEDSLRIHSNDPEDPVVVVPVNLLKNPTDDAWLSLDASGSPMLTDLSVEASSSPVIHFFLRNVSDTAHSLVFPMCFEARWFEVDSACFDSTTFPDPHLWNFTIGDTAVNDTGQLSFYAFTMLFDRGIPPGLENKRIGTATLDARGCGWMSSIDTCRFDGHGSLSYTNSSTGEEFVPSWQFVSVEASDSLCGDTKGTCSLTTGDAFLLLNYFGGGPRPVSCWSADINGDGYITTGDGFMLL
jgi:hypothetical protein